jgi:hypothetical protein
MLKAFRHSQPSSLGIQESAIALVTRLRVVVGDTLHSEHCPKNVSRPRRVRDGKGENCHLHARKKSTSIATRKTRFLATTYCPIVHSALKCPCAIWSFRSCNTPAHSPIDNSSFKAVRPGP